MTYVRKQPRANWLTVKNAKPVRSAKAAHDDRQIAAVGSRRAAFKVRRPLRPVSKRRAGERQRYKIESRAFVAAARARGETCPVMAAFAELSEAMQAVLVVPWTGNRRSNELTENHHKRGRAGSLLMDKRHWMPSSQFGHRAIHMFPCEARRRGWLCETGLWNVPDRSKVI